MLGEVPSGWGKVRVGDLGATYNGLSGKSKEDFGGGSPFVTYRQVFSGKPIDPSECEFVQVGPTENQSAVRKGDVLFTTSSETVEEVAFSAIVRDDVPTLYLNSFCFGFRPHYSAPLDFEFAEHFFRGPDFRSAAVRLGQGSTRYNISKTKLMEVLLPLPPLAEQKKIAAILSSVDEAIQATQAVIDQTRRVKEGLLQDLLTRGIGHTRFKQTEIGEIPEGWEVKRLSDLTDFVTSGSRGWSEFYADSGALFVRITNLSRNSIDIDLSKPQYVALPDGSSEGTRTRLQPGDVLVSITADLGIIGLVGNDLGEAYVNQHIALVRLATEGCLPAFVAYYLSSRAGQEQFGVRNDAGAKAGLTLQSVRSVRVPVPPLAEQTQIVHHLRATEREVTQCEAVARRLAATKSGLLADLLTGKVRVTP